MAKRKKQEEFDEVLIDVVDATDDARDFIQDKGKFLIIGLGVVALIVGAFFAYKYLVQKPKQKEAIEQMFQAEFRFDQDSFKLALENPGGGYMGFIDIIDSYKGTPAANMANYYAGVSYMNLGEFEAAASYLNSFKAKDELFAIMKFSALGDMAGEQGDFDKALSLYKKAINAGDNNVLTPIVLKKTAFLHKKQGDAEASRKAFETIKDKYPKSQEAKEAIKYVH